MKRKNRFTPECLDVLEARVVLSHVAMHGLSTVASGLSPRQQVLNSRQQPIIAEVNQAFDSFTSDYDQARATYFASILNVANPSTATTNAFTLYTKQRVSLLAEQVISCFLLVTPGIGTSDRTTCGFETIGFRKVDQSSGPRSRGVAGSLALGFDSARGHFGAHRVALFAYTR